MIFGAVEVDKSQPPRAHNIGGVAMSAVFLEELVGLQGVRGGNLEIEFSPRLCSKGQGPDATPSVATEVALTSSNG